MTIEQYWPTERDCLECIRPEAENPADSVFLAVHQTMRFIRRSFGSSTGEEKSEKQLLSEFLKDDPSGRVIIPILGESGIGKSHVIRWLDVKLRQLADSPKRHVIRIPKSSSLKSVLGLILKNLEGSGYDDIRRQLHNAREQMDAITARQRVRAELLSAIEKKANEATRRIAQARESGNAPDPQDILWQNHGDNRYLPAIFGDAAASRLFMDGTPSRPGIFAELARHLTKDTSIKESPRRQFEEDDFVIPPELVDEITSQGGRLAIKYLQRLGSTNGRDRADATRLLNEIVDDAIKPLATPADTSLSELFYDIRRQLLNEGRELVLLVEDFAVLAGIQGALFDAMIREGEVSGKAEACVMRTALAVTTGYFLQFDTVKTRATYGWYIDEVPEDDEDVTVDRFCDFFGAYLNAARIGVNGLESHYAKTRGRDYTPPSFDDLAADMEEFEGQLEAFGRSSKGHSLFPLNRAAVVELTDWKARTSDSSRRLKFNPRSLLNDILLPILRGYRDAYLSAQFPPLSFLGYDRNTVDLKLRNDVTNANVVNRDQILTLLRFWDNNPQGISKISLNVGVFQAFGLTPIDRVSTSTSSKTHPRIPQLVEKAKEPQSVAEDVPLPPSESPDLITWHQKMREWRTGLQLQQRDANRLRILIRDHLLQLIDWDAQLLIPVRKEDVDHEWIYLPNARGGPAIPGNTLLVVAADEEFADPDVAGRVNAFVIALLRYEEHKTWNYPDSESDYVAYANFFSSRLEPSVEWLSSNYKKMQGDPVPAITESLLWGARLLNVPAAHSRDDVALLDALFALPEKQTFGNEPWDTHRLECQDHRESLREELLTRLGARQGGGDKVHAIDVTRLLPVLKQIRKDWKVTSEFPKPYQSDEPGKRLQMHVREITRSGTSTVKKWQQAVNKHSQAVLKQVGQEFDKNSIIENLKETASAARQFGIRGEITHGKIEELLDALQKAPAVECLQYIRSISDTEDTGGLMSALAQLDTQTLGLLTDFVATSTQYIAQTKRQIESQVDNWGDEVVQNETNAVDALLAELQLLTHRALGDQT
jgi:hypothetical protein